LREILAALDDQLTGDQLNEMIAEIDSDSSGTVDFEGKHHNHDEYSKINNNFFTEFMEMMTGD